jgi:transport and golgi organization protein 1
MIDLIVTLALTALVVLIFILGYYCINKSRREGPLLAKINGLERHLMASLKETALLKAEVLDTRNKLVSIEDNSFGSNDMVIALRKELDGAEQVNQELQDQVDGLEKELENAAEAGLELNKMVSELLSNQTGSDSIISSVEELQRQLNEQQETIISMNSALALKSRENSELQILIGEQTNRLKNQFEELQSSYDQLMLEHTQIEAELSAAQRSQNDQIRDINETKGQEIQRLSDEVEQYKRRYIEADAAKRLSAAKVEALETCVQEMKKGVTGELGELMDVAELKADLLAVTKEKDILRESLDGELDARRLLEERVRVVNEEVSQLKKDYTKAEQEKTATETRLEILSSYFKEKEAQLQK